MIRDRIFIANQMLLGDPGKSESRSLRVESELALESVLPRRGSDQFQHDIILITIQGDDAQHDVDRFRYSTATLSGSCHESFSDDVRELAVLLFQTNNKLLELRVEAMHPVAEHLRLDVVDRVLEHADIGDLGSDDMAVSEVFLSWVQRQQMSLFGGLRHVSVPLRKRNTSRRT